MLTLLYFAWLRERLGRASEQVALPAGVADVAGLVAWQRARGPEFASAFADANRVRAAVNQEFAQAGHPVQAGDEVAFFPPVTGG